MVLNIQQLQKKLVGRVTQLADGLETKAQIVSVAQDGYDSFRVIGEPNKIWVQLFGGDEKDIHEAYNIAVQPLAGMFVYVRKDGLDYSVIRPAPREATDYLGEAAGSFATPDKIGALAQTVVADRNYAPGRVGLFNDPESASADLTVTVAPFWYRHCGIYTRWPGGAIDLAAYLPVTTAYWHWALVCIWSYTNDLVVVTGTEYADYALLTDSTLADLTTAIEGLVPCDAVKLQADMTVLDRNVYFQFGRLTAAETGPSAVPDEISSAYYHIPAGRKASWPQTLTINGGTLTLEGTVLIR